MDTAQIKDMMGRHLECPFPARRVVSLVPSQTEFLLDIGVNVVGRTKFCVHPQEKVGSIPIVGGTKQFRREVIRQLNPDLIIGNKEENEQKEIEQLANEYPVWMSDIHSLSEAYEMMQSLGELVGKASDAEGVISQCKTAMEAVEGTCKGRVVYLIWKNPWMAAGKQTFIDHLLEYLGYQNSLTSARYPQLTMQEMQQLNPERVFLSSEPFPFKDKHIYEVQSVWPNAICELVDGELYSWYGSHLKQWNNH